MEDIDVNIAGDGPVEFANLLLLSNFLEKHVDNAVFNMSHFRGLDNRVSEFFSKEDCGTHGCMIGWAPFCKGLETQLSDFCGDLIVPELQWEEYCDRIFNINENSVLWVVLFSDGWSGIDNTTEGAVQRIRFVCENYDEIDWESWERKRNCSYMTSLLRDFLELMHSYENG